jgi:saccharopepsin
LRSVYSVYDFGDFDSNNQMGNPYVKLMPIITADGASAEFAKERGTTARTGITYTPLDTIANAGSSGGDTTTVTLSTDVAKVLDTLGKYFPAIAGVLALNAIVLLVLLFLALFYVCRRRKSSSGTARRRSQIGRTSRALTPMPMNDATDFTQPPQQAHVYEPVSMALSEAETILVPPSPGFAKGKAKDVDRPYSFAGSSRMSTSYGPESPQDEPFTPPPPPRRMYSGDGAANRPKSLAV